jgi:GDP-4-dehydro-6-deoxy-D-mannose reductase
MKALITGIAGFAGSHLAEYLLRQQTAEVYGTVRANTRLNHIKHLERDVRLMECPLTDPSAVEQVLAQVQPDHIYHLAAQSFVPASWSNPAETLHNNVFGQLHMLEAVRRLQLDCKILIACSSEEYGHVEPGELPVQESNPLRPLSPYAVSKVTQDYMGYQYYKNYGMFIIRTRSFNHTGPRHGENMVTSNFAKQIAEIEKGSRPPVLMVGNLQAKRDFSDVRDVVRAYSLVLEKGKAGECYNVASGTGITIAELLRELLSLSSLTIRTEEDPLRLRPSDVEALVGDYSKLHETTGWKPEIPLRQTLEDLLNYWRSTIAQ